MLNYDSSSLGFVDSGNKLYKGHKKSMKDFTAVLKILSPLNDRIIYNLTKWKFGFTTCIELAGDKLHTTKYITKYIIKDCKKILGQFFWHSRDRKKPDITFENIDYDNVDSKEYFNDYVSIFLRQVRKTDVLRLKRNAWLNIVKFAMIQFMVLCLTVKLVNCTMMIYLIILTLMTNG